MKKILAFIITRILELRYSITFAGLGAIGTRNKILFLPNHPAEIDPVILLSKLWANFAPRTIVVEDFYYSPGLRWLMKQIRAIPIPNMMTGAGSYKRLRVERALDSVVDCLERGENVLVYPAGRLMQSGSENLRAAGAVQEILERVPDATVVLVRTRGLIGSSFSFVVHQCRPDAWQCVVNGARHVLSNLIFFTPRRDITVDFGIAPSGFPRAEDKMTINRWLEGWYNSHGEEEISLVSYSMWREHYFEPKSQDLKAEKDSRDVADHVQDKVKAFLSQLSGVNIDRIREDQLLSNDLGLDSLGVASVIAWLNDEFFTLQINPLDLNYVRDVIAAADGKLQDQVRILPEKLKARWFDNRERPAPLIPNVEKTIHVNFLDTCARLRNFPAIADEASGVLTYQQVKTRILLLADIITLYPGTRIGIMLPASATTAITIYACLVAGKTPVMLNWTLGDSNLRHVIDVAGVTKILTSSKFLDQLSQLDIKPLLQQIEILEDIITTRVTLRRKVGAALLSQRSSSAITQIYRQSSDDSEATAIILFTSGSEAKPKGVPLSHRNILANIKGCLATIGLTASDAIYGFLPPFHSFGLTVTAILPTITGVRVVFHPNPLEGSKLAVGISFWKPTIVCGTPGFISGIFRAAKPVQLEGLKMVLVGAEKAPDALFSVAARLCDAKVIEGYGITECSPVLTINGSGTAGHGVGQAITGVEIIIVNEETKTLVPVAEQGLILVRGPNVFGGYLPGGASNPFIEIEGDPWYNTGDLGYLDNKGNLTISGRLKRFVKIGGEMISLPAMEESIRTHFKDTEGDPHSALGYAEDDRERAVICLLTVTDRSLSEINEALRSAGFSNLSRVSRVIKIDEIPLLGTGKIDYVTLNDRLLEDLSGP